MEINSLPILTIKDSFKVELYFIDTKLPFAKTTINILLNKLNVFEEETNKLEILKEKLEEISQKHFADNPKQMLLMQYCKTKIEKDFFKVFLHNKNLCFFRNGLFLNIDSQVLFKEHFEKLPLEDDAYLESVGFPSLPERKGKSCFSCFTIHQDGNLYVNPYRQDTMQHTFTTMGNNVLCAGLMYLVDGKIHYIDNRSGHYLSTPQHLKIFFDFLEKNKKNTLTTDYFCENFNFSREHFSEYPIEIINERQFGINFHKFGEKTQVELLNERNIRREITDALSITIE